MRQRRILVAGIVAGVLVVLLLVVLLYPQPEVLYQVTFLPALGGRIPVTPQAINDRGQVVGIAEVAKSQWHMFFWDEDQGMLDMGPRAYDPVQINNAGQIASGAVDPNGDCHAFLQDPNGVRYVLPAPNGRHVHVQGLNSRGQVVGYHDAERSPRRVFVWDRTSGMQELAPPNTLESIARGINDAGQVVGYLSVDRTNDRSIRVPVEPERRPERDPPSPGSQGRCRVRRGGHEQQWSDRGPADPEESARSHRRDPGADQVACRPRLRPQNIDHLTLCASNMASEECVAATRGGIAHVTGLVWCLGGLAAASHKGTAVRKKPDERGAFLLPSPF